jgi:hypothetical protein
MASIVLAFLSGDERRRRGETAGEVKSRQCPTMRGSRRRSDGGKGGEELVEGWQTGDWRIGWGSVEGGHGER